MQEITNNWLVHACIVEENSQELCQMIKNQANFNVNYASMKLTQDVPFLGLACQKENVDIVVLLLSHPEIMINHVFYGHINFSNMTVMRACTPFSMCCFLGCPKSLSLLLKDCRIKTVKVGYGYIAPLVEAAHHGKIEVVKVWISSGRKLECLEDALKVESKVSLSTVKLLEEFQAAPDAVRHRLRLEIGWYHETAAETFALVIFFCEKLLEVKDEEKNLNTRRFFRLLAKLPIELQMSICYKHAGIMRDVIKSEETDKAFRHLAMRYLYH
jgi:hypothetical protein